jgi:hypothetical protein
MSPAALASQKRPADMETSVPAFIHWPAITLVPTKLAGHFRNESWRSHARFERA